MATMQLLTLLLIVACVVDTGAIRTGRSLHQDVPTPSPSSDPASPVPVDSPIPDPPSTAPAATPFPLRLEVGANFGSGFSDGHTLPQVVGNAVLPGLGNSISGYGRIADRDPPCVPTGGCASTNDNAWHIGIGPGEDKLVMGSATTIVDNPGGSAGAVNGGAGVALTVGDRTYQLGMETAVAYAKGADLATTTGAAGNNSATAAAFGPFPTWSFSNSLLTGGAPVTFPVILPLALFTGGSALNTGGPWTLLG